MYLSLARKYRPKTFGDVAVQSHVSNTLKGAIARGRVAHGYLLLAWGAGLFVEPAPGPVLANYGLENLRFITPVAAGDSIRVTLTAKKITPRETDEYGEVAWDAVLTNQNDEIVATYDVLTLVEK